MLDCVVNSDRSHLSIRPYYRLLQRAARLSTGYTRGMIER